MCLLARYISNIMLDGLRADHQSSQPGTPLGSGINVAGFGDSCVCPPAAGFLALHIAALRALGCSLAQTAQRKPRLVTDRTLARTILV